MTKRIITIEAKPAFTEKYPLFATRGLVALWQPLGKLLRFWTSLFGHPAPPCDLPGRESFAGAS